MRAHVVEARSTGSAGDSVRVRFSDARDDRSPRWHRYAVAVTLTKRGTDPRPRQRWWGVVRTPGNTHHTRTGISTSSQFVVCHGVRRCDHPTRQEGPQTGGRAARDRRYRHSGMLTEQPWSYRLPFERVVGAEPGSRWATAVDARPSRANRSSAGPGGPALRLAIGPCASSALQ